MFEKLLKANPRLKEKMLLSEYFFVDNDTLNDSVYPLTKTKSTEEIVAHIEEQIDANFFANYFFQLVSIELTEAFHHFFGIDYVYVKDYIEDDKISTNLLLANESFREGLETSEYFNNHLTLTSNEMLKRLIEEVIHLFTVLNYDMSFDVSEYIK